MSSLLASAFQNRLKRKINHSAQKRLKLERVGKLAVYHIFLFIGPGEARELMIFGSTGDSKGRRVCVAVSFRSYTQGLFISTYR